MTNSEFLITIFMRLLAGLPLTLEITAITLVLSLTLAFILALMSLSGHPVPRAIARAYLFLFRGTPVLVQLFLVYYGSGQFAFIRHSFLWPYLREPFWCAVVALSLYQASYVSEVLRGGFQSVTLGHLEAARSCGMSKMLMFRRIVLPLAIRQSLPAYSNEIVRAVQVTSLTSTITLNEITGIARDIISQTYSVFPTIAVSGLLYLSINFAITRLVWLIEYRLTPYTRPPRLVVSTQLVSAPSL
jgi:octopine/nopaline transport system permease protein